MRSGSYAQLLQYVMLRVNGSQLKANLSRSVHGTQFARWAWQYNDHC